MNYRILILTPILVSCCVLASSELDAQSNVRRGNSVITQQPWRGQAKRSSQKNYTPVIKSGYARQDQVPNQDLADQDPDTVRPFLEKSLADWPEQTMRELRIDVRERSTVVPEDRSGQLINGSLSDWSTLQPTEKIFAWTAPNIRYQPLYFEDVALERYGLTYRHKGAQSTAASIHFFSSTLTLPYQMFFDPVHSCDHPLGYCRPGNDTPCTKQKFLFWRH